VASSYRHDQSLSRALHSQSIQKEGGTLSYEETMACLGNYPKSNPSLDQASLDDLHMHFASWCQKQDRHPDEAIARFTTFLVLDEFRFRTCKKSGLLLLNTWICLRSARATLTRRPSGRLDCTLTRAYIHNEQKSFGKRFFRSNIGHILA